MKGDTIPRLFTPPLAPLEPRSEETEKRTLGYLLIDFSEEVCGISLLPYQKWLAVHGLEVRPNGRLRFRNVIVLVARQNGKSTFSQILALFALYVMQVLLVLGTAQDLEVAEEIWAGAVEIVDEVDDLNRLKRSVSLVNGKKALILRDGKRYKVKASNRRAARGLSGDLIMLDELREHLDWQAWAAITKTTMARPNAQVWGFSNAGDDASIVLKHLRTAAIKRLGDPFGELPQSPEGLEGLDDYDQDTSGLDAMAGIGEEDDIGLFEWSAEPGKSKWDREGWKQANPALGYTILESTIASACRTDPEFLFRTEVLCQWTLGSGGGLFPPKAWEDCRLPYGDVVPEHERIGPTGVAAGIDMNESKSLTTITVAGIHPGTGRPQLEVAVQRAGLDWVEDWFCDPASPHRAAWPIVILPDSPARALLDPLKKAGLRVEEMPTRERQIAWGWLFEHVRARTLRHKGDPALNRAALAATAGANGIDRAGQRVDPAPMFAGQGALWRVLTPAPDPRTPQPPRQATRATPHPILTAQF